METSMVGSGESSPLLSEAKESTVSLFCSRNHGPLSTSSAPLGKSRSGDADTATTESTSQYTLSTEYMDSLSVAELRKLKDLILLRVYSMSELLVNLLQERAQLSEEAHVRAISIEQLHKLHQIPGYFFYRGIRSIIPHS